MAHGLFSGWREWQIFVLFDTLLGAAALVASVKLLAGDPPLQGRLHRLARAARLS